MECSLVIDLEKSLGEKSETVEIDVDWALANVNSPSEATAQVLEQSEFGFGPLGPILRQANIVRYFISCKDGIMHGGPGTLRIGLFSLNWEIWYKMKSLYYI